MKRTLLVLAALALAIIAAPTALADAGKKEKLIDVRVLAFNDFHGHLEANTPGGIAVGCCELAGSPATLGPISRPAGGIGYFTTWLKRLGSESPNTIVASAGDLIGASPLASALFHDEPTIKAMNLAGLDVIGVGNHEFDEGKAELRRMQEGGCHPTDTEHTCPDGQPFEGSLFQYLAANVIDRDTNNPLLPEYKIFEKSGEKIAFIGETLQGTPLIVTPTGVAGLEFLDEADSANRLVPRLRAQGVQAMVLLLHEGGTQNAPFANGFMNVNGCENFTGPDLIDILDRLDREIDVVVSAHTHQPYRCTIGGRLVTGAASFGRVISQIDLKIKREAGEVESATAWNVPVLQTDYVDSPYYPVPGASAATLQAASATAATPVFTTGTPVPQDPAAVALVNHYAPYSAPLANRKIGSITADILSARGTPRGDNRAGEQPMGNVIADGMLAATSAADFGGAVAAFMNVGGVRSSLFYAPPPGSSQAPGDVTYGEAFTVQPFGNTLVVKTCTGQQLYDVLEQQFENPAAGQQRVMAVSGVTYSYTRVVPAGQKRVTDGSLKIGGVVVDKAAGYRVAMNNFIADGGDGFSVFKTCTNALGGEVDIDAFARYLMANSPLAPPPLNRITRLD